MWSANTYFIGFTESRDGPGLGYHPEAFDTKLRQMTQT